MKPYCLWSRYLATGCVACTLLLSGIARAEATHFTSDEARACFRIFNEGQAAYRKKDYAGYLEKNRQLVGMALQPAAAAEVQAYRTSARYNVACALALSGQKDQALAALASAVDAGFDAIHDLRNDADLASLRGDARFKEICDRAEKLNQAAGQKLELTGTLVRLPHAAQLALVVPSKDANVQPTVLKLESSDAALLKKAGECCDKRSAVKMTGQGGTHSHEMTFYPQTVEAEGVAKK